jgi:phosphatidylserine/phosphatidylglycerophosphate/cardiolipin synthase-like enzyme
MSRARGAPARLLLLLALAVTLLSFYYFHPDRSLSLSDLNGVAEAARARDEQHFSPSEDLEQLDHERLDRAQHTIDIAMYSFTDRYLAEELRTLARRGVRIRIYRDRQQYEEEQHNAREHNHLSTNEILRGEPNIQLRIKAAHELMHLKAYLVDGRLLRAGSANWSSSGLKRDNNLHFTADPAQIRAFQQEFEQMWNRLDNEKVS